MTLYGHQSMNIRGPPINSALDGGVDLINNSLPLSHLSDSQPRLV